MASLQMRLQNTAASISVINRTDLKSDGITSVLNKIPGLYMQQILNTIKISIRGIGSRSQYGTQKIKGIMKGSFNYC
jgi:iron complex outermembrane receptor protein